VQAAPLTFLGIQSKLFLGESGRRRVEHGSGGVRAAVHERVPLVQRDELAIEISNQRAASDLLANDVNSIARRGAE
jgi:hypothetical protein